MIKFTPEEISLCKQVAEKHRKEIKNGDWIYQPEEKRYYLFHGGFNITPFKWEIPLWTISDCLEFFEKTKDITLRICSHPKFNQTTVEYDDSEYYGKTPLEACLKAVLAVLVEGV